MKKQIIVDANIIFARLRTNDSETRKKLLSGKYQFLSPNFIFAEIFKHKERIFKNAKATEAETYEFLSMILEKIHFVNEELISTENFFEAYYLCKDVDTKDIPYIALSLELNAPLWTRDEKLKDALSLKGFSLFFDEMSF